jgi:hypothetical protein
MALWTPAQISTEFWVDASDSSTLFDATTGGSTPADGDPVARWEDKSGNGRHITQSTVGQRPLRQTASQNSLDIVEFDGSNDNLNRSAFMPNTFTAFMVGKKRDLSVVRMAWLSQNNNTFNAGRLILFSERNLGSILARLQVGTFGDATGTPSGAFSQWGYTRNGTSGNVYRNAVGTSVTTGSATIQAVDFSLGRDNNANTTGCTDMDIGEVIVLSGVASTSDRQIIEGYLAWKWGIQGDLPAGHPYEFSAPTIGTKDNRRRRYAGGYGL